jgi:hypothetical protein
VVAHEARADEQPQGGDGDGDAGASSGHQKSTSLSVSFHVAGVVIVLPARSLMPEPTVHDMFFAVTAVDWTLLGVPSVTTIERPSAERIIVELKVVAALT